MNDKQKTFLERLDKIEKTKQHVSQDGPVVRRSHNMLGGIMEHAGKFICGFFIIGGLLVASSALKDWKGFQQVSMTDVIGAAVLKNAISMVEPTVRIDLEDPTTWRQYSKTGVRVYSPGVLGADTLTVRYSDIVNATLPDMIQGTPNAFLPIAAEPACYVSGPYVGEKLVSVNIASTTQATNLNAFSYESAMIDLEQYFVNALKYDELSLSFLPKKKYADYLRNLRPANVVNLYVTDESAPIYLVLQSSQRGTIWNIHAAPNVDIAHVVVVGSSNNSIIAKDIGDKVQFLNFAALNQEKIPQFSKTHCPAVVRRLPTEDFRRPEKAGNNTDKIDIAKKIGLGIDINQALDFETNMQKSKAGTKFKSDYDKWFQNVFGTTSHQQQYTARIAGHILVGPVPDQPLEYQPIQSSTLIHDAATTFSEDAQDDIMVKYDDLISKVSGGGKQDIIPPLKF